MTKLVLFSAENIKKAKDAIAPYAVAFHKAEPKNTMVMPETREGMKILEDAMGVLEKMGYSPEDAQLLLSDVVEKVRTGEDPESHIARPFGKPGPDKNQF